MVGLIYYYNTHYPLWTVVGAESADCTFWEGRVHILHHCSYLGILGIITEQYLVLSMGIIGIS